jgi:hypothetical protein
MCGEGIFFEVSHLVSDALITTLHPPPENVNGIIRSVHELYKGPSWSSVGITLDYGLDDRGSRVRFLAGAGNFSLHHCVQNGSGAHPASYPMSTRGSFPWIKRPGHEADHSPQSSAEVKNAWSYTSTPQYVFTA